MQSVRGFYQWAEANPLGVLGAAFLVYVAVGSITGSALAVPMTDDLRREGAQLCWPISWYYTMETLCAEPQGQIFWLFAVVLPVSLLEGLVRLLIQATYEGAKPFDEVAIAIVTVKTLIFVVPAAVGFRALWRAPILFWLVLIALSAEIVYLRLQIPDGQALLRTITG